MYRCPNRIAAVSALLALASCSRSHTIDGGELRDAGPLACFEMTPEECEAAPRWFCNYKPSDERDYCPVMPGSHCFPRKNIERGPIQDGLDAEGWLRGCFLEQPCPDGSKLCTIGSCSGGTGQEAGEPWVATLDLCRANVVFTNGRRTSLHYHDWFSFCIPEDATAGDYACDTIEVLE